MIAFISGHLDLTEEEFNHHYKPAIDLALRQGYHFVVGDARGADAMAQTYLKGKTLQVFVYHMLDSPRNNVGNFTVIGHFNTDTFRDEAMTLHSDYDIAWIRDGREMSGTARNIARRRKMNHKWETGDVLCDSGNIIMETVELHKDCIVTVHCPHKEKDGHCEFRYVGECGFQYEIDELGVVQLNG